MSKSSSACGRLRGIFKRSTSFRPPAAATATKKRGTLEKMVSRFKKCSESSSFRSRYDIYAITVKRLIKYNRLPMINEILDHQKNFPDMTNETFTAHLIYLYGKAGMFDDARKLFDEMPDLKCPRTVFSFNALLSACINARRFDEIKKLLADFRSELGITFDVVSYSIAINGFCKMGDLVSAEMVFDEMIKSDVEPNLITFNTLLNGFYLNGKFADGERIWSRMVEMNVVPDVRSYNAKLHALALDNRMKEAIELVEEMRDTGLELDVFSFNALIRGFINGEDLEEAKQWYGEMRRHGCEPNRVTFQFLIPFLCEKGDVGFAVEICEEIFDKKWHARAEVLQLVVNRLVMEAKIQDAEKLVKDGQKHKYELLMP
ncbi:PREDICTED: pentatricopeptide repeat-containing protein At1g55890, mitochondrial-like [Populus euphratica]|uniref:Pentatricopeptide repeat-containing protein At1g55890, mitochondrial-like n=1 Tax=Populus euphratica TaxID=75702 RepID=A0AAJ6T3P8_POPEU|nr:PREDICTED: pentatricopeptide repeat-containing protein At1g55890, mitochondrial-like [Populus euphratica]